MPYYHMHPPYHPPYHQQNTSKPALIIIFFEMILFIFGTVIS